MIPYIFYKHKYVIKCIEKFWKDVLQTDDSYFHLLPLQRWERGVRFRGVVKVDFILFLKKRCSCSLYN